MILQDTDTVTSSSTTHATLGSNPSDPTVVVLREWWSVGFGTSNGQRVCANVFDVKSKQATAYVYQVRRN